MSGRLIIATKKSYNPWGIEQRARVARDEAAASDKHERKRAKESETSLDVSLALIRKRKKGEEAGEQFSLFPEESEKARGEREEEARKRERPQDKKSARDAQVNKDGTPTVGDFALVTLPTSSRSKMPGFWNGGGEVERRRERTDREDPLNEFKGQGGRRPGAAAKPAPAKGGEPPPLGDWKCACGAVNFRRREVCFRCGAAEGGDERGGERAEAAGETKDEKRDKKEKKENKETTSKASKEERFEEARRKAAKRQERERAKREKAVEESRSRSKWGPPL
jgi:hypothetical protein